jgi:hypothetical protein
VAISPWPGSRNDLTALDDFVLQCGNTERARLAKVPPAQLVECQTRGCRPSGFGM